MRILTIIILTLLVNNFTFGQNNNSLSEQDSVFLKYNKDESGESLNYAIDTMLFESSFKRHILIGTVALPWTQNQIDAKAFGVNLDKVTKSDCKWGAEEIGKEFKTHINSILTTDTTIIVDFNFVDNCCFDFLCDIKVDKNGILNLIYNGYGTFCACQCCFGLTYHFSIMKSVNQPPIRAIMIQGDKKTLKQIKN